MQTVASMFMIGGWKLLSLQNYVKNVHYIQFYLHLNPHFGENLFQNYGPHYPSHLLNYRPMLSLPHFLHMLININAMMFQLETNFNLHEFILTSLTKSTLKQQPTISMGTQENLNQTKGIKIKIGGYEGIPSMGIMKNLVHQNHITLQLELQKNYYTTTPLLKHGNTSN